MRSILIISFSCLISILSFAQNHFVFEESNWYFSNPDDTLGNPFADYTYYEYIQDTIIEEEICKFIYSSAGDHVIIHEREDKVYYYALNRFNLLYDFDVVVNDTIYLDLRTMTFLMSPTDEFILIDTILSVKSIVKEVDSIAINDNYFRKVFVDIFPESDILEFAIWPSGFGYFEFLGYTIDGIIPLLIVGMGPAINTNRNLRCYSDSRLFYMDSYWQQFGVDCDFRITSIPKIDHGDFVSIYPNPVKDYLYIEVNNCSGSVSIELIDIAGRKLFLDKPFDDRTDINLTSLYPGLYFLVIKNPNFDTQTYKILKIK